MPTNDRTNPGAESNGGRAYGPPPGAFALEGDDEFSTPGCAVVDFNAETELARSLEGLADGERVLVDAVRRRAAAALSRAIEVSPHAALFAIEKALAITCTKPSNDAAQETALTMVRMAVCALYGDEDARGAVANVGAFLQGAKDKDSNPVTVRAIASEVSLCVAFPHGGDVPHAGPSANDDPGHLLRFLTRFDGSVGERLDGQQLSKWLGLYSHEQAPNMLTLTGIVAHILRHGRLCGRTEKEPYENVVRYVDTTLKPQEILFKPRT